MQGGHVGGERRKQGWFRKSFVKSQCGDCESFAGLCRTGVIFTLLSLILVVMCALLMNPMVSFDCLAGIYLCA